MPHRSKKLKVSWSFISRCRTQVSVFPLNDRPRSLIVSRKQTDPPPANTAGQAWVLRSAGSWSKQWAERSASKVRLGAVARSGLTLSLRNRLGKNAALRHLHWDQPI